MHQAPVSEDERLSVLDVQNTVKRQMNVQAHYAKCGREVAKVNVFSHPRTMDVMTTQLATLFTRIGRDWPTQ